MSISTSIRVVFVVILLCLATTGCESPGDETEIEVADSEQDQASDGEVAGDTENDTEQNQDSESGASSDSTPGEEDTATASLDTELVGTDSVEEDDSDSQADSVLYVDVRSEGEYAAGHYPGAVNVPLGSLVARQAELYPKDRHIIVYCASGNRSAKAKSILEQEGFTNVEDGGGLSELARAYIIHRFSETFYGLLKLPPAFCGSGAQLLFPVGEGHL